VIDARQPPIAGPLIILAPGRSFSSVICAMLGQHPALYGLPETHLLTRNTLAEWLRDYGGTIHDHGLARAIAETMFGGQSPQTVWLARAWLWACDSSCSTSLVLSELGRVVSPLTLIEKSPGLTYDVNHMERARSQFPQARFLHILRHPYSYGLSLIDFFRKALERRSAAEMFAQLNDRESMFFGMIFDGETIDPQLAWYVRQKDILTFLQRVRPESHYRIHGEHLVRDPDCHLRNILRWLGLSSSPAIIEGMKHPERSPFARFGPWNAPFGGDPKFLSNPVLRRIPAETETLHNPPPWRSRSKGQLRPEVLQLARECGYL
jgi:hypothetical protein